MSLRSKMNRDRDVACTSREVKTYCTAFLYDRLVEAQERYDRIMQCQCQALGGDACTCTAGGHGQPNGVVENGVVENGVIGKPPPQFDRGRQSDRGRRARLGLLKNNRSTWCTQSLDEEDKAAIARVAGLATNAHIPPLPTLPKRALPEYKLNKLVRRPSFTEQVYDGIKNPYVLVINNVNFHLNPAPRCGAGADMKNLMRFLDKAGFLDRKQHFDLTKQEMMDAIESVRQDPNLVEHDGFICIIMSHGNKRGIQGKDLKFVDVDDITKPFQGHCCPELATKPKLFFIQACRGNDVDDGFIVPRGKPGSGEHVESDDNHDFELPVKLPSEADFLIAYSSTKGKASFRRFTTDRAYMAAHVATMGSWFISCLVDVFLAYSHKEDVMSMLTRVNLAMSELYSEAGHKQMACQLSMLTKKLFFANLVERHNRITEGND